MPARWPSRNFQAPGGEFNFDFSKCLQRLVATKLANSTLRPFGRRGDGASRIEPEFQPIRQFSDWTSVTASCPRAAAASSSDLATALGAHFRPSTCSDFSQNSYGAQWRVRPPLAVADLASSPRRHLIRIITSGPLLRRAGPLFRPESGPGRATRQTFKPCSR
jgi:hypothetical protein